MNKIYRLVWNTVLNAWVAVSELTKAKGKKASKITGAIALSSLAVMAHAETQVTNTVTETTPTNTTNTQTNSLIQPKSLITINLSGDALLANVLGGGAATGLLGNFTLPDYIIQGVSVNNIGSALTAVDTKLTSTSSALGSLTTLVNTNVSSVGTLTTNLTNLTSKVDTNVGAIAGINTNLGSLTSLVNTNVGAVADINTNLGSLTNLVNTNVGAVANINTNLGSLTSLVNTNVGAVADINTNLGSLTNLVNANVGAVADINTNLGSLGNLVDANVDAVADLNLNLGSLSNLVDTNVAAVADLNLNLGSLSNLVDANVSALADLDVNVGSLTNLLNTNIGAVANLGVDLGILRADLDLNINALDSTETNLAQVAEAFGAGANIDVNGVFTKPNYQIQNGSFNNVGDALTALDTSITANTNTLTKNTQDIDGIANSLGAGAHVDVNGTFTAPQYMIQNGSYNNVGDALTKLDTTLTTTTQATNQNTSTLATHTSNLTSLASAFGAGAQIDANGTFTAPRYVLQGGTYNNVGDAFNWLDSYVTTNNSDINNIYNQLSQLNPGGGGTSLVLQDGAGNITVGATTNGTNVSITGTDGVRSLAGLKDGSIASGSTEAVTGNQLNNTNELVAQNTSNIGQLANSLGGGASVDANGTFTAPSYTVQGSTVATVGDALTALDSSVTTNKTDITNLTNIINSGSVGLVQQDATSLDITVASATGGTNVSFAGTDGVRTLTGIKDGSVVAGSTEAITGSQLNTTNELVAQNTNTIVEVANSLGGGANVDANGAFTAPSYTVQGSTVNTVGDALTALDGSVTTNTTNIAQNTTDITNIINNLNTGAIGLVKQDPNSKAIRIAADVDGDTVTVEGTAGVRTLSGLKDAVLSSGSTEAVTGRQLDETNQIVSQNTTNITNLTNNITNGAIGLVTQDANSRAIRIASELDGDTVTVEGTAGVRTLSGLKDGSIAAGSTEAITGSQLNDTNELVVQNTADITTNTTNISSIANSLGGGASIDANGTFTAPSYTVQGSSVTTVGDALTALDGSVTTNSTNIAQNTTDITNLTNIINSGSVGLVQQDATSLDITVASSTGGSNVSFAGTDGVRTLTGIKDGSVAAGSTEAITGSQLNDTNELVAQNTADITINTTNIGSVANSLGGGASVDANGTFTAPSYTVQGSSVSTVGDALTALDSSVTTNTTDITNLTNIINSGSVGLVQQDATSLDITVASATGGTNVSFAGTDGVRTLTGIKDGSVAAGSTEAITGSQLNDTNELVAQNTANITTNTAAITQNTADIATNTTNISSIANSLGGGASIDANGTFTAPSYTVQGSSVSTVGDALTALDSSVTTNTTDITNLTNIINSGSVGLVQQDATSLDITVASATGGTNVSFAGTDGVRTLTGIKDGSVAAGSTDAITGGQLNDTNELVAQNTANITTNTAAITQNTADIATNTTNISSIANSLGGGASIDANGTFTAPSYTVQGSSVTTVGDALTALDGSVTTNTTNINQNTTDITNLTNIINSGSVGLVQQDATSLDITVASATGGTNVSFAGTDGVRTLTGIKDGSVAAGSTDAITGGQLNDTNELVAQNTANITTNTAAITQNTTDIATNTTNIATNTTNISSVANSLGGGASIDANGTFTAPSYTVQGSSVTTVGDALTVLDSSVTTNSTDITNLTNIINSGSVGLVQQDATSLDITVASATGGSNVSFAGTDGVRTLTGIKDGSVAAGSTEAITGSQLNDTNELVAQNTANITTNTTAITQNTTDIATNTTNIATNTTNISSIANSLGGGASIDANGTFTAPSYTVQGSSVSTVGDALTALDSSVTTNSTDITNLTNIINSGSVGLVQQDATSLDITVASATGGTNVSFAGTDGVRTLTGIKDGSVVAGSTDAITGGQLNDTNELVAQNTANITTNTAAITQNTTDIATNTTNISSIANSLGGGASIDANGTFTAPSYTVQGSSVTTVGDALTVLDMGVTNNTTNITNIMNQITDIGNGTTGPVRWDGQTNGTITVGSDWEGATVSFASMSGNSRTLTNISAGINDSDATNAAQLKALLASLGGGANLDASGNIVGSMYNIQGGSKNLSDSLSALDQSVNTLKQQTTAAGNAVMYDTNNPNKVTLGNASSTGPVTITNVANGNVAIGSTDAVNGGQLASVQNQVDQNTNDIADLNNAINNISNGAGLVQQDSTTNEITVGKDTGGTSVNIAGTEGDRVLSGIKNGVADNDAATVGQVKAATAISSNNTSRYGLPRSSGRDSLAVGNGASADGDESIALGENTSATGSRSVALGSGSRASGNNSVALGDDSIALRDNAVSVGSEGAERQITNVAAGTAGTDAVNVNQLNEGLTRINTINNERFNHLDRRIDDLDDKLSGGVAAAMAMSGIPQAYLPGASMAGASMSSYRGESAIAVGVSTILPNGKWVLKLTGSGNTQSEFGVSAGVGYQW
ncbi:ESPR-type extended signal peptide-containing protein [Neisseria sp. Ec49-e6-T10]|uniref:ESPR-type extended signal peptide-containing protein n=1 Tax=Neisseria sp. Ec49-e6-T10 TaxID=3140744 RepID=UPI003EBD72E8